MSKPRYAATNYHHSLYSVVDTETGSIVDYARSQSEADTLAARWNAHNGRPPIAPMADCSWLNDSDMDTAILSRPARKTERSKGIAI